MRTRVRIHTLPDAHANVPARSRCLDLRPRTLTSTTPTCGLVAVWAVPPDADVVVATQAQGSHTPGLHPWCRMHKLVLLPWGCRGLGVREHCALARLVLRLGAHACMFLLQVFCRGFTAQPLVHATPVCRQASGHACMHAGMH